MKAILIGRDEAVSFHDLPLFMEPPRVWNIPVLPRASVQYSDEALNPLPTVEKRVFNFCGTTRWGLAIYEEEP